jgi:hypothetical protein
MSWTMNNKAPLIFPTLLLVKSNVCVCIYRHTQRSPLNNFSYPLKYFCFSKPPRFYCFFIAWKLQLFLDNFLFLVSE